MALQNLKISFQRDEDKGNKEKEYTSLAAEIVLEEESNSNLGFDDIVVNNSNAEKPQKKPRMYENKGLGSFAIGFDPTLQENVSRRQKRSERFGTQWSAIAQEDYNIEQLYERLGLSKEDVETGGDKGWRLNTVHMRGVDEMSTGDIFQYFDGYAPTNIEWIDDTSCNVLWSDREGAGRALLARSQLAAGIVQGYLPADEQVKAKKLAKDAKQASKKEKSSKSKAEKEKAKSKEEKKLSKTTARVDEKMEEDDLSFSLVDDEEAGKVKAAKAGDKQASSSSSSSSSDSDSDSSSSSSSSSDNSSSDSDNENMDSDKASRKAAGQLPSNKQVDMDEGEIEDNSVGNQDNPDLDPATKGSPPGTWLTGQPCSKAHGTLYLRFANRDDRKLPGAEKRSKYYVKYGNPNFGGMVGLLSASRRRRIKSEALKTETAEARRAVKRTAKARTGGDSFDDLLKEAKKRQKVDSGSESDKLESESNNEDGAVASDEDGGDVLVKLGPVDNVMPMLRMMRADVEEEEKQMRKERLEEMRMTHAPHPQSRIVGDVRAQIEQRRQQRNVGGQSRDSNKVVDLRQRLGQKR